jgi:prepilin-type N-terminal cleavage/methylation domain-containing protein
MRREKGFTLVEVIIATFISTLMLMAIYTAVNTSQTTSGQIERRVAAQQDARGALELMAMEIQMASYNPTLSNIIWVDPNSCTNQSLNLTYRGIQVAGPNSMTIEMDINGSGSVASNAVIPNPNETIQYAYNATDQYITRTTNCSSVTQPFLGGPAANADSRTVLVVNNTAGPNNTPIPVFRYYDGNGNLLSPDGTGSIGAGIPNIRRVEIRLVADTYSTDKNGSRRRITYSTSVIPRNHSLPTF